MDGVLADSEPLHQHAIRLLLAEYGVDWMPDGRDPTVGLTSLESFAIICERQALRHDPRHLDALYTARVLPLLRERVTPLPGVPDVPRAAPPPFPRRHAGAPRPPGPAHLPAVR